AKRAQPGIRRLNVLDAAIVEIEQPISGGEDEQEVPIVEGADARHVTFEASERVEHAAGLRMVHPDLVVTAGRYQPMPSGHHDLVDRSLIAARLADHNARGQCVHGINHGIDSWTITDSILRHPIRMFETTLRLGVAAALSDTWLPVKSNLGSNPKDNCGDASVATGPVTIDRRGASP